MLKKQDNYELSVYSGELTPRCLAINAKKVQQAFPALGADFFTVMSERLTENNYCDERLENAVNYVIDNCIYPTPTIAQFLAFDKRIKLYDYKQMLELLENIGAKPFSKLYKSVRIGNNERPMYASINDINEFGLELWNK